MITHQDFEERVQVLLHGAANGVPSDLDLMPAIAEHIHASPLRPRLKVRSRWIYPALAATLAIAVVVSAFTWAQPLIFQWLGTSALEGATLEHATTINRSVTVQGITLHVEQAYADAALTAVTFHLTAQQSAGEHVDFGVDGRPEIIASDQTHYGMITGAGLNADYVYEFEPLPLDKLGSPQTLMLVLPSLRAEGGSVGPGPSIQGPWQLTFQITPQAGRSITFDMAPATHDGVTIQPLRLDLAPAGARLLVRFSGLAPNTELFPLKHFVTHQELGGIEPIQGLGPRVSVSLQGTSDGGPLQLKGPDGQQLIPAWIAMPSELPAVDQGLPVNQQVVGPSGTVVLSVLFFTPLQATHGIAQLSLDLVDVATRGASGNESERLAHGPWTFALPLGAP